MRNIGPKSRVWLAEVDVQTIEELQTLGAIETYARLRFRFGNKITRNMLHALAAAVDGIDWRHLPAQRKAELDEQAGERLARFDLTRS